MNKFYTSVEKWGNDILYVYYEGNQRLVERIEYCPTLFVPTGLIPKKDGAYKTLNGVSVDSIQPGFMKDCKEFIEKTSSHNYKIYGNTDYVSAFISDEYPNGCTPDISVMNILYLDIEVASNDGFPHPEDAKSEVTAITVKHSTDDVFYTWGCGAYDAEDNVRYMKCSNERDLLQRFITHWAQDTPDVITGWNVEGFDIPYLFNRIKMLFGSKELKRFSLFGNASCEKTKFGNDWKVKIQGTSCLDYLALFRKFGYSYGQPENFKLDTIGQLVVGENKLDYSEYSSLQDLYLNNHQKFIEYNIKDVHLVERIEEKAGLIQLALTLAHKANSTYGSTFGSVRIWECFVYNVLKRMNVVIPQKTFSDDDRSIEGGYVKEPIKGAHKWVASFDANSLYPHLIMQYNLSPETVRTMFGGHSVDDLLNGKELNIPKDCNITPGGLTTTNTSKGLFPQIIDGLYNERVLIKNEMLKVQQKMESNKTLELERMNDRLNNEQMAIKILMNSLYGAMANKHFLYFNANMAEAITFSGQLTIRWAERAVNNYLQKIMGDNKDRVIAIDTDSLYITFDDLIQKYKKNNNDAESSKFIDDIARKAIEPMFEKTFDSLAKYLNAYEQKIVMGREVIASKMIITGKKRYIANVLNNEGVQYNEPKMKITGIESVRSSTPMYCRSLIKDTLHIIMNKDETTLQKHIAMHRAKWNKLRVEDIAFPRGVSDIVKYTNRDGTYSKGTPIAVRASILYNKMIKEKNIDKRYETIFNGDKIKFVYLKMPNPLKENVIAFSSVLPPEFKLHSYVDYDIQYEKTFVDPMTTICDAIGWKVVKQGSLENFFN